jgi:hypothetical protein
MEKPSDRANPTAKARQDARAERLAAELRANLKRRKAAPRTAEHDGSALKAPEIDEKS